MPTATTKAKTTPDTDLETGYVLWDGVKYEVKKRFKVGKFLRLLSSNPGEALQEIFTPEAFEAYEEIEFTFAEFGDFMSEVSDAIGAGDQKN
jgi:hypothetical protein